MDLKSCFPVAFLLDNLAGGGAEQVLLNLAGEFVRRGHPVALLVCSEEGALREKVPVGVSLVVLPAGSPFLSLLRCISADPGSLAAWLKSIAAERGLPRSLRPVSSLANYLREHRPAILLSNLPKACLTALWAGELARVPTQVVVSVQNHLAAQDAVAIAIRHGRIRRVRIIA